MGLLDNIMEPGGLMGTGGTPTERLQRQMTWANIGAAGAALLQGAGPQGSPYPIPDRNPLATAVTAYNDPRNMLGPMRMAQFQMRAEEAEAEKKRREAQDAARQRLVSLMTPTGGGFPGSLSGLDTSQPSAMPNDKAGSLMGGGGVSMMAPLDNPEFMAAAMNYSPAMGFSALSAAESRRATEAYRKQMAEERARDNARADAQLGLMRDRYSLADRRYEEEQERKRREDEAWRNVPNMLGLPYGGDPVALMSPGGEGMPRTGPTVDAASRLPANPALGGVGNLIRSGSRPLVEFGLKQLYGTDSQGRPTAMERNTEFIASTLGIPKSEALEKYMRGKDAGEQDLFIRTYAAGLQSHMDAAEAAASADAAVSAYRSRFGRGMSPGGPARVTNKAEVDRLPSGTQFIGPDGVLRVKP